MKVIFVYPDIEFTQADAPGNYHYGIGHLASVLKQRGHQVSLLHITRPIEKNDYCKQLAGHLVSGNNLVAFSATTNKFPYVDVWSKWTKENFSVFTICGGVHTTLNAESAIRASGLDAICLGEGEYALAELCDGLDNRDNVVAIPNLWIKKDKEIYRNAPRPLVQDLDTLPFPDREVFDYVNLYHEREHKAGVKASRGCPYDCHYCCNRALSEVHKGQRYVRFRSVDNVINELRQILDRYPFIRSFAFEDDILPLKKDWFENFATEYRNKIGLPFTCNIRPNLITERIAELLKEAGCYLVQMGIESGNSRIRYDILNRHISDEQIINAARVCRDKGMKIFIFNILGLPHESMPQILDTIKLNAAVGADSMQATIFFPYYRTKLFDVCKEEGYLTDKEVMDYYEDTCLAINGTLRRQVLFAARYFLVLVRTYESLFKLPKFMRQGAINLHDSFLTSRVAALVVFPVMIKMVSIIFKYEILFKFFRSVKRRIFDRIFVI